MKHFFGSLLFLTVMALLPSGACADNCGSGAAKITEAAKKFSVIVPRSAGLGEQSYDDIGCAVVARNGECATRQGMFDSGAIVRDYSTGEDLATEKAFFVLRTDVQTPQGYGIAAFKDRAGAEKFSADHGKGSVVRWFELVDEKLK